MSNVTLQNLASGALEERFERELKKVLANIADPNTDAKKKRTVDIKVVIVPSENREAGKLTFSVKSSLAPATAVETIIVMDEENAAEVGNSAPGQMKLNTETGELTETPQVVNHKLVHIAGRA